MLAILQACQGIPQAKSLMQNVVRRKLEGKLSQLDVPFYLSTKTILNEAMFYIVHVGKLLKAFHQVTPCHIFSMKYTLSWSIKHRWTLQFFHKHMIIYRMILPLCWEFCPHYVSAPLAMCTHDQCCDSCCKVELLE